MRVLTATEMFSISGGNAAIYIGAVVLVPVFIMAKYAVCVVCEYQSFKSSTKLYDSNTFQENPIINTAISYNVFKEAAYNCLSFSWPCACL